MNTGNKNSFFSLEVYTGNENAYQQSQKSNQVDLILSAMGVKAKPYLFENKNEGILYYYFRTEDRKRKGQLAKYCQQYLGDQEYDFDAMTKQSFDFKIALLKQNSSCNLLEDPNQFEEYNANDIKLFDDKSKWHPWQKEIYEKVFNQDGSFKKPDQRQIISLIDTKGNSGKSSFFKWLFYNNPETIGRIGYGSASQLRSSSVNLGKKNLYIIDLARSKSKDDKQEDLLSVLEDLKSGLVTTAMYGAGKTLLMEPPHIIVSSNYQLKYELLSADRWGVFQISKHKTLKKIDPKPAKETLLKK